MLGYGDPLKDHKIPYIAIKFKKSFLNLTDFTMREMRLLSKPFADDLDSLPTTQFIFAQSIGDFFDGNSIQFCHKIYTHICRCIASSFGTKQKQAAHHILYSMRLMTHLLIFLEFRTHASNHLEFWPFNSLTKFWFDNYMLITSFLFLTIWFLNRP